MAIKVIFFDAGGTLVRPVRPVGHLYAELAWHYGQRWDGERVHAHFLEVFHRNRAQARRLVPEDGDDRRWWEVVVREAIEGEEVPSSFPFEDYFAELYGLMGRADLWRVFGDVEPVLMQLREEGFRLAVLSNWDARLYSVLRGLRLVDYFEEVLVSAALGVEKPQPALYAKALERVGVRAEEALMVGDDRVHDKEAPEQLGWHALVIERPQSHLGRVISWLGLTSQTGPGL